MEKWYDKHWPKDLEIVIKIEKKICISGENARIIQVLVKIDNKLYHFFKIMITDYDFLLTKCAKLECGLSKWSYSWKLKLGVLHYQIFCFYLISNFYFKQQSFQRCFSSRNVTNATKSPNEKPFEMDCFVCTHFKRFEKKNSHYRIYLNHSLCAE